MLASAWKDRQGRVNKKGSEKKSPDQADERVWVVLIHIIFVTPVWCLTEIWTLHLRPAEPPQWYRYPEDTFPQCVTKLMLSFSKRCQFETRTSFYILNVKKKREGIISQLPCKYLLLGARTFKGIVKKLLWINCAFMIILLGGWNTDHMVSFALGSLVLCDSQS